jgi:succinate dehydrogenase/fumarate reductase flavoprotein subunit
VPSPRVDDTEQQLHADVLVIGGGPAAAWAAWAASEQGAKVIVVDKGYLGTSGSAAASGNGVLVVPPQDRDQVVKQRVQAGRGMVDVAWLERMLECTWQSMPLVEQWGYSFPQRDGKVMRGSYYGPEYMRVLRKRLLQGGVRILDQSPALELLVGSDGAVAGARGIRRQEHAYYRVRAGAVVLATGGCAFLSRALGSNVNTGDALLMAVEAGADLSGMELSSQYGISSALNATATRGVPYGWATFYDAEGHELGGMNTGRDGGDWFLPRALLRGPVYAELNRATPEVRAVIEKSHFIAFLPLRKAGIDPYTQRFPVTLVLEGTVRGAGGVRLVSDDCAASIPGLYAAGDAATRELIAGAASGGGGPNAAWTIASGQWAGTGAAKFALALGAQAHGRKAEAAGQVGLARHARGTGFDPDRIIRGVQDELFPLDKNYYRSEATLTGSLAQLDRLWEELRDAPRLESVREVERARTAANLLATARWSYRSGLRRRETRGLNRRVDHPALDPNQTHYQLTGGLDQIWTRDQAVRS